MFSRSAVRRAFICLIACAPVFAAAPQTQFVLVSQFLFSEIHPDPHFGSTDDLADRFRTAFRDRFKDQVLELSATRLLSPGERAVIIVPRITAVRASREVAGGTKYIFAANVAGSVSAVDPWSGSTLYGATRLESGKVELGQSKLGMTDADLAEAFKRAYDRWMEVCFDELSRRLTFFALSAPTLAVPPAAGKSAGGAWPFGRERGVAPGQLLTGGCCVARVSAAFDGYSLITDAADASRVIPAGESYSLTVVDSPSDRHEPRVAVEWVGPPPSAPNGLAFPPSVDAAVTLFIDYLSKGSALRILPPSFSDTDERNKYLQMTQEVSRFAGVVHREVIDLQREAVLQLASENPDFRIVLFTSGSYFGTQTNPNGVYHVHRVSLGAALLVRHGNEQSAAYGLAQVFLQNEELKLLSSAGIREVDDQAASFTVWRDAAIQLAGKVLSSGRLSSAAGEVVVETEVRAGSPPAWPSGLAPDSHTPLEWLRPVGNIALNDGKTSRPFFRVQSPSQGFLTPAALSGESLKTGDHLRYVRTTTPAELLPLHVDLVLGGAAPLLPPEVLSEVLAGRMAEALHREVVLVDKTRPPALSDLPLLYLNLSAFHESQTSGEIDFTADWRLLLVVGPAKTVAAKVGRHTTEHFTEAQLGGTSPPDNTELRLQFLGASLDKLVAGMGEEGLDRVLTALPRSEGTK
jgi:hypothetical protein